MKSRSIHAWRRLARAAAGATILALTLPLTAMSTPPGEAPAAAQTEVEAAQAGDQDVAAASDSTAQSQPESEPQPASEAQDTSEAPAPPAEGDGADATSVTADSDDAPASEEASSEEAAPSSEEAAPSSEAPPVREAASGDESTETSEDEGADQPAAPSQEASAVLTKEASVAGPLQPGDEFAYQLFVGCTGAVDCTDLVLTDTLPSELTVDAASLPNSTPTRRVEWDAATNTLTITFLQPTSAPEGVGMTAASESAFSLDVEVTLPADTSLTDGSTISNTATLTGSNLATKTATTDLEVDIPRVLNPRVVSSWAPKSAIAGSDVDTTLTLNVNHVSSSSTRIQTLAVTEASQTWDYHDLTSVAVTEFPSGADRAQLMVALASEPTTWIPVGAALTQAGEFPLGNDVASNAVGVRVMFSAADGSVLPRQDDGSGKVALRTQLRDTVRSTGADLSAIESAVAVTSTAYATAIDAEGGVDSPAATSAFTIDTRTITLSHNIKFFADGNGDYRSTPGAEDVFAVQGAGSPVSAITNARNTSRTAVEQITLTAPAPGSASDWGKVAWSKARIRVPAGSTAVVTMQPGDVETELTAGEYEIPVSNPGSLSVTFRNVGVNALVGLDLHGAIDDSKTTADDLEGSGSPEMGINQCVGITAGSGAGGSGGFGAVPCAKMAYWPEGGQAIGAGKTASQTRVPAGQEVLFSISANNLGKAALRDVVLSDPEVDGAGKPVEDSTFWSQFDLVSMELTSTPEALGTGTIQVYRNGVWEDYAESADPQSVGGVRVVYDGELPGGQNAAASFVAIRKAGVADGETITNCAQARGTVVSDSDQKLKYSACLDLTTERGNLAAAAHVSITEASVPAPAPGLTPRTIHAQLRGSNQGIVNADWVGVTTEGDFFDTFALTAIDASKTQLPAGASQVQVDAFVDGAWVEGAPSARGALPAGVDPAEVTQLRVTFSGSDGIVPCTTSTCEGSVNFTASPRTGAEVGDHTLTVTGSAGGEGTATVDRTDPASDIIALVAGTPQVTLGEEFSTASLRAGDQVSSTVTMTNSGTGGVTTPRIVSLVPAELDVLDPSDYTVSVTGLPDGYPSAPTPSLVPVFDAATGELTSLEWTFENWTLPVGATISIGLNGITLAPGVAAGTDIVAWVGATSTDETLTCASSATGDRTYGESDVWCETSDSIRVQSGTAFQAREWVGSAAAFDWYNSATDQVVAVGDSSCPTLVRGDATYTRNPCTPLMQSGSEFQWLLMVTNAGTEYAGRVTIYDNLPGSGDVTVVGGRTRGSDWTPEGGAIVAAGADISTSSDYVTCSSEALRHDVGAGCGTWTARAATKAVKLDWQFADGERLAPGAGVEATITSRVPAIVGTSGILTVNNSFAHVETTYSSISGGTQRHLPGFESRQASAGQAFGTFEVRKEIGSNPVGLAAEDLTFEIAYTCTDPAGGTSSGTGDLSLAAPWRSGALPVGTSCQVWESNAQGATSSNPEASPAVVTIARDTTVLDGQQRPVTVSGADPVVITNDFSAASLTVSTSSTGAGAAAFGSGPFAFTAVCEFNGSTVAEESFTLSDGDSQVVGPLPVGAECVVTETDSAGADAATPQQTVTVPSEGVSVPFSNEFGAATISVSNTLDGPGAELAAMLGVDYVVELRCLAPDGVTSLVDQTLTVKANESVTLMRDGEPVLLPLGSACWASQVSPMAGVATSIDHGSQADAVVTASEDYSEVSNASIAAVNTYDLATLTVTKTVRGGAGMTGPFEFTMTCTAPLGADGADVAVFEEIFELSDGESTAREVLEGSSCAVVETPVEGATVSYQSTGGSQDGSAVLTADTRIDVTNSYPMPVPTPVPSPGQPTPSVEPSQTPSVMPHPTVSGTSTPSGAPTATSGATPASVGRGLASTGASLAGALGLGILLLGLGGLLLAARRGKSTIG